MDMSIDVNDKLIDKLSISLNKFEIADEKRDEFKRDLPKILDFVEQLSEVDTSRAEAKTNIMDQALPLREDKVTDGNRVDEILKNAPDQQAGMIGVPKIVE